MSRTIKSPTNAELEVLEILWQKKKATVREVHDTISVTKTCVYTSTLKTMQKMTAKKLIGRVTNEQGHVYHALIQESKVRNNQVNELIDKFFNGSYSKLALHALGNTSKDENIDELVKLINDLKRNKK